MRPFDAFLDRDGLVGASSPADDDHLVRRRHEESGWDRQPADEKQREPQAEPDQGHPESFSVEHRSRGNHGESHEEGPSRRPPLSESHVLDILTREKGSDGRQLLADTFDEDAGDTLNKHEEAGSVLIEGVARTDFGRDEASL